MDYSYRFSLSYCFLITAFDDWHCFLNNCRRMAENINTVLEMRLQVIYLHISVSFSLLPPVYRSKLFDAVGRPQVQLWSCQQTQIRHRREPRFGKCGLGCRFLWRNNLTWRNCWKAWNIIIFFIIFTIISILFIHMLGFSIL